MAKKPEKRHTWVRTELSEHYFIPKDVGDAPRVTRVNSDGSKIHYRLKRSAGSEEEALGEIVVGKELNSIGIIAPFPEKVEGRIVKGSKRKPYLLYPEIEGETLKDKIIAGVENKDFSFLKLFSALGEEDAKIVQHVVKTGKNELLCFEHLDRHILVTPEGRLARVDVAPFPDHMERLKNKKFTKETALLELVPTFFTFTTYSIALAESPDSLKTKAIKGVIDNYFKGVGKVFGAKRAKSAKEKVLKELKSDGCSAYDHI